MIKVLEWKGWSPKNNPDYGKGKNDVTIDLMGRRASSGKRAWEESREIETKKVEGFGRR